MDPIERIHHTARNRRRLQTGDHLSTFGGNPVSCAASLANIEFIEQQGLAARPPRPRLRHAKLRELQKAQPLIAEVRGSGLMIAWNWSKTEADASDLRSEGIRDALLRQGVAGRCGGVYGNVIPLQRL